MPETERPSRKKCILIRAKNEFLNQVNRSVKEEFQYEELMSKEMVLEYDTKRLSLIRFWCLVQATLFLVLHIYSHLNDEFSGGEAIYILYKYFHWGITAIELILCW